MIKTSLSADVVAAVIPALNEAAAISQVVQAVSKYAKPVVVDDGSSDQTAALARIAGAEVVVHPKTQGYDSALETGLFHAIKLGYEFAITLDGDGQHSPATLELFKEKLANGADVVVGVRDRHQRFAESLFAFVGKHFYGVRDPLCGMKGYRLDLLSRADHFDSYRSIGTELTLRASRSNCRIEEVDVLTRDRTGQSRFGNGVIANGKILRALMLGFLRVRPIP